MVLFDVYLKKIKKDKTSKTYIFQMTITQQSNSFIFDMEARKVFVYIPSICDLSLHSIRLNQTLHQNIQKHFFI